MAGEDVTKGPGVGGADAEVAGVAGGVGAHVAGASTKAAPSAETAAVPA